MIVSAESLSLLKQTRLLLTGPKPSERKQKDSIVISGSWPLRKCLRNSVRLLFSATEIHWGLPAQVRTLPTTFICHFREFHTSM